MMEIRRIGENDLHIAEDILKSFMENTGNESLLPSKEHVTGFLKNETCYLIAAMDKNTITGFALAYRFPSFYAGENTAYLYDIEVLPEHRKKGIGRLLVEHLLLQLKNDGVHEIWLGTGTENLPAQRLFSTTGAQKEVETFYEYFY